MKWLTRFAAAGALLCLVLSFTSIRSDADSSGKSIFLANKCNNCHSISAAGIKAAPSEDDSGGTKPPDLSKVGGTQSAAWIQGYLTKQESLHGKKHKKAWKGSDADLATLAGWLASLK